MSVGRSVGRSDRNVPFHLSKLLSSVPLLCVFCIPLTRTITKRASVQPEYVPRNEHVEFPKFQSGIFVKWKALINNSNNNNNNNNNNNKYL